jgi:3'-5' exoribonuclease
MRQLYLRDCQPGDFLEDVYVLSQKQFSTTSTNKTYVKAFIGDRSMQVTARIWNASRATFDLLPDSGFVRIRARIENYQGNLQMIIEDVRPVALGEFDISDLIPHTTRDIPQMCARLHTLCASIRNRHLKAIVQAYLDDKDLMDRLCRAPAAQSFHHAFLGGLLEHTLNSMDVADSIVKFYPGLNRDLLLAGILLHDIAKIWELSYECSFGYTDGGQLVGHIVKSAIWIEQKAQEAAARIGEPISQPLVDVLQHIIISHHGLPEYGAVKLPATPEAIAVHFIENLDAKLMMSLTATRGDAHAGAEGNWTEYMKAMGTRLYRPDVAMPDMDPTPGGSHTAPHAPAAPPVQPATPATAAATSRPSNGHPPTMKVNISNPLFEAAMPAKRK